MALTSDQVRPGPDRVRNQPGWLNQVHGTHHPLRAVEAGPGHPQRREKERGQARRGPQSITPEATTAPRRESSTEPYAPAEIQLLVNLLDEWDYRLSLSGSPHRSFSTKRLGFRRKAS